MTKTYLAKESEIKKKWYLADAEGRILGRLASRIAMILMGKHKPTYTSYIDTGDFVVVVNADKVKVSGKKAMEKTYKSYSGYADGLKVVPYEKMLKKHPERIVFLAVKRMIPSTRLGNRMIKKLKVYAGPNHSQQAQQPVPIEESPGWSADVMLERGTKKRKEAKA